MFDTKQREGTQCYAEGTHDVGQHRDVETMPAGLTSMPPGPELAAMLASIDARRLSGFDRVTLVATYQRMVSHYTARLHEAMLSVVDHFTEDGDEHEVFDGAAEAAAVEVRAALRLSRRAADAAMGLALDLRRRLPRVLAALAAGRLDLARARVLIDGTLHLTVLQARQIVEEIIDRAPELTAGELRALLRRRCAEVIPEESWSRHCEAVDARRVSAQMTVDGTVTIVGVDLPPDRAAAGMARIDRIARSLRGRGETRGMNQLRADVFLDLLEGVEPSASSGRGSIDLRVGLDTLAELNDQPGDLAGYGPVLADVTRQVVDRFGDARWHWTLTHPQTGAILDTGTTRTRPSRAERRFVEARDSTCVFPGCRRPAVECDLDHRIPLSEGGPTDVDHLAALCRFDHDTVRHRLGWTYEALNEGDYLWISPVGHRYTTSGRSP